MVVRVEASTGKRDFLSAFFGRDARALAQFQVAIDIFQHHHGVIDQARERQRQPAQHHALMEPPPIESAMKAASAESGIEKNTATVARMLPRNTRIMTDVRKSPMAPSCSSVSMAVLTKTRLIEYHAGDQCLGTSKRCSHGFFDAVHHGDRVGVAALLQHRQVDRCAGRPRAPCWSESAAASSA